MPVSASAICCTSAAGMVTGDIAPIRMNGVSTTAWLASAYSKSESSIRSSQRSGELQLISEIVAGVCSMLARPASRPLPPPNRIEAELDGVLRVGPGDDVAHEDLVGQRRQRVGHVEVAAVQRGVVGLADHAAGRVEDRERLGELGEVAVVVHGRVAAYVALAHERRAVDRAERHRVAADVDGVGGVARLYVELAGRLRDLLEDPLGVEEDLVLLDLLARRARAGRARAGS